MTAKGIKLNKGKTEKMQFIWSGIGIKLNKGKTEKMQFIWSGMLHHLSKLLSLHLEVLQSRCPLKPCVWMWCLTVS